MHNISNTSPSAAPSAKQLLFSTLLALSIALIILITAILPAEYGLDPTGLGQHIGLTALHQPDNKGTHAPKTSTSPTAQLENQAHTKKQPVQKLANKWHSKRISLNLPPQRGQEVKLLMETGETILFHWQTENGTVSFDMHGNQVDAAEDDFTSYWLGQSETQASGTFSAPFSGLHGWYWENETDQAMEVVLEVEGYYQDLVLH